jgi:O-antigen/teichoic acid export membrane protein
MSSKKRFAINVVMNWVAMATGMVVPFFLMPFVVRHLGPVAYGIWILAVSTSSYLALLDMGLRSAIVRFVSRNTTAGNLVEAQKAIQAGLWVRSGIAGVVSLLSIALAIAFPHLFKIPYDLQRAGQISVLLCALGVATTLISGVFGAVLSGINRFDILSSIVVGQTLSRAVGLVLILRSGHGLVALAAWEFLIGFIGSVLTVAAALKVYPPCRIRLSRPDTETLKTILSYSLKTFIIIIASQIIFYTDNVVVGAFLSVGTVTLYSIAGSLAMYSGQVSTAVGTTFIPIASGYDASGQIGNLQKLLLRGSQAMLGLMLPIGLSLLLRGKTFIGLWMGPQYSETSGTILQILLISQFFTIANATAGQIAFGIDKHKSVAKAMAIEAGLNLGLSIVLVHTMGLYGVAWGTAISRVLVHLIFWPRYVRKELGVSEKTYLWEGWGKVTLFSIPFAIVCVAADRHWHPHSLVEFFGEILVTLPVYFICTLWIFKDEVIIMWRSWRGPKQFSEQELAGG